MATAIDKVLLSGSTNGKNIKVVATADAGTTIHTAVSGTSSLDEIWLYADNTSASAVTLTIEFGSNASPDDLIAAVLPATSGVVLVIPGYLLQNSLVTKAYASSANVVLINGFVNRIS